jgi:hypothetical protein
MTLRIANDSRGVVWSFKYRSLNFYEFEAALIVDG